MSGINFTKFGVVEGVSAPIQAYVTTSIASATQDFISQQGSVTVDAIPKYTNTGGKVVKGSNVLIDEFDDLLVGGSVEIGTNVLGNSYFLPLGRPSAGDYIVQFDGGGSSNFVPAGVPVVPPFINTLTVQNLSQGTSELNQNYILPQQLSSSNFTKVAQIQYDGRYITINPSIALFRLAINGTGSYTSYTFPDGLINVATIVDTLQTFYNTVFIPPNNVEFDILQDGNINLIGFGTILSVNVLSPLGQYLGFPTATSVSLVGTVPTFTLQKPFVGNFVKNQAVFSEIANSTNTQSITCNEIGSITVLGNMDFGLNNLFEVGSISSTASTLTSTCGQSQLQLASIADGTSVSNTTYLSSGSGSMNTAFATTVGEALIVRDGGTGTVLRVNVGAETILKNAPDRECIRVYDYGVQIKGEGQPLATGVRCSLNMDGDIFFNREDPVFGLKEIFLTQGSHTRIWSPSTASEVDIDESYFRIQRTNVEMLRVDNTGTKVNQAYYLPTTAGTTGQVLTRNSGTSSVWASPQILGFYSQTSPVTVVSTTIQTSIIGAGVGSLTVPANYFTTGMGFTYRTGGLFGALNNATIRFRLTNSGILFDSGLLQFSPAVAAGRPWNIDVTFIYIGGTTMITNFNFQYNNNSDARGFTAQNTNSTFNPAIINTLGFTAQWGASSLSNAIVTNYGVLTKIY